MPKLSDLQVGDYAYRAGVTYAGDIAIAIAIAEAESGFDSDAVGDEHLQTDKWGPSIGLWQIRSLKSETGTGGIRDASRLKDPQFNARSMASISKNGKDFASAWSTWGPAVLANRIIYAPAAAAVVAAKGNASKTIGSAISAIPDAAEAVTDGASAVANAASDASQALRATHAWLSDRNNWIRIAFVVAGGAVLIGALVAIVRPAAEAVAVPKVLKKVVGK